MLTIDQYVSRRLTRSFVRTAAEKSREHRQELSAISKKYGVSSSVLVAVWGMESNFGRFTGTRPTIQALATLAWEGRRRAFFTTELINALQILDKGYIELGQMKGSWAGAMGQTQFMPSSYLAHAQDYDGDGRRDIWSTLPDVFASIANYMIAYGWKDDQIWGREVKVPPGGATKLAASVGFRQSGCRAARELSVPIPLAKWQSLGVRTAAGAALPRSPATPRCCAPARSPIWSTPTTTRCSAITARTPTPWPLACFPIAWTRRFRSWTAIPETCLQHQPSASTVTTVLSLAALSIAAGVYFGGTGQLPLAMTGAVLFVILGGVGFELARRRS